eukprot:scaffold9795_cov166-Amphora_coffeaeformis.AAC.2
MNSQGLPRSRNDGAPSAVPLPPEVPTPSPYSTKAGLFVDRAGSKPLPLSGTRFVLPNLTFKKKTGSTNTRAATILRRAGKESAFSDQGEAQLSGDEDHVADAWICQHCSSKNHTRSKGLCTICKKVTTNPNIENRPTAQPRRGRRHERDGGSTDQGTTSARLRGYGESSSRSWSPPPSHQRQHEQQQHQQMPSTPDPPQNAPSPRQTRSLSPGVVPLNPFGQVTPQQQQTSSPYQPPSGPHRITPEPIRTVPRATSFDSAFPMATPPHQDSLTAAPAASVHSQRSASPAFSATTSVDTPIHSNKSQQDPFAPYPHLQHLQQQLQLSKIMLRPIQSASDIECSASVFRDEGDDNRTIASTEERAHGCPAGLLRAPQPNIDSDEEEQPRQRGSRNPAGAQLRQGVRNAEYDAFTDRSLPPSSISTATTMDQPLVPNSVSSPSDMPASNPLASHDAPHSLGDECSDLDTMAEYEHMHETHIEQGTSRGIAGSSRKKTYVQRINIVLLVAVIFLMLVAGFVFIYFVALDDSDDRAFGDDVIGPLRDVDVAARIPTQSPFVTPGNAPTIPVDNTENPTTSPIILPLAPTTSAPVVLGPTPPSWVLQSARLGDGAGTRFGQTMAITANGTRVAISQGAGRIQLFDISEGIPPTRVGDEITIVGANLLSFDIDDAGTTLAACLDSGAVLIYSLEDGNGVWRAQQALQLVEETVEVMSVSMANSGDLLAVGFIRSDWSSPVQLWAFDEESSTWYLSDETTRSGTFDALYLDLAADGTMLAISKRQFVGQALQTGFISVLFIDQTLTFADAGFVATGRSSPQVSLSANGMRMAVSNVDGMEGGWSLFVFSPQETRWIALQPAAGASPSQGVAISATLSGDGTSVVVVSSLGKVFLRQQIVAVNFLSWVTLEVVDDTTAQEAMSVSLSRDASTVVVGRPWYAVGTTRNVGLVQIYRDS